MTVTRIKVDREQLIAKLEERQRKLGETHERETAKYPDELDAFRSKLGAALEQFLAQLEAEPTRALKRVERYRCEEGVVAVELRGAGLHKPSKPEGKSHEVAKLDRLIAPLRMSTEATISVAADDQYARYL